MADLTIVQQIATNKEKGIYKRSWLKNLAFDSFQYMQVNGLFSGREKSCISNRNKHRLENIVKKSPL